MAKIPALQLQGQKATATNEATAIEAFETAFS
jgi:hypothetical protein